MRVRSLIAIAVLAGSWWAIGAVAQDEITGGDVRYVLDEKYGLTSDGYAEYRKCIAEVQIGIPMNAYKAGLEECKKQAKRTAFHIATQSSPEGGIGVSPETPDIRSQSPLDSVVQDRAWQKDKYKQQKLDK